MDCTAKTREEILEERRRLKAEYGKLYNSIAELLFSHDPVGISFEINKDDVLRVVHEEFVRWFDPSTTGPQELYAEIASEIWKLWQRFRRDSQITTGT